MKLQWTKQANKQLVDAVDYVHLENPKAADRQEKIILKAAESLLKFPSMGREGRVQGTRELPVAETPYIVVYEIGERAIRLLALLHGAQRWPVRFKH